MLCHCKQTATVRKSAHAFNLHLLFKRDLISTEVAFEKQHVQCNILTVNGIKGAIAPPSLAIPEPAPRANVLVCNIQISTQRNAFESKQ